MEPPVTLDGANDAAAALKTQAADSGYKLKFCTVCASNQNRYVSLNPH